MNGLGDVFGLDCRLAFEVSNRAGNFQDTIVGAGGEALLNHGTLQQTLAISGKFAVGTNMAGSHLGIAIELVP